MPISRSFRRQKIIAEDRLRCCGALRSVLGRSRLLLAGRARCADPQRAARQIDRLCGAARLVGDGRVLRRIESQISRRVAAIDGQRIDWSEFLVGNDDRRISKGTFLKPYVGPREKGVVFISFEDQWVRLIRARDLREFSKRYTLVVAPTWCPPHSLVNTVFPALYPDSIFTLISNERDLEIFPRLSERYIPIPVYASSWVNPAFYAPRAPDQRDIDIVMIANFGKYKRHHVLFRALRGMAPTVRAMLVGQPQRSRDAQTILQEAKAFGVDDRITVHSRVSNEFLADALCRARISLILSRREGSCVAVAESLFADTPVGLLADAEIGSRSFINASTGRLLSERGLAAQLSAFLHEASEYRPRQWAERNISCHVSSRSLNESLRRDAIASGRQWTRDIATLFWRPDPQVERPEDSTAWIEQEQAYVRDRHGIEIGPACEEVGERCGTSGRRIPCRVETTVTAGT